LLLILLCEVHAPACALASASVPKAYARQNMPDASGI
jgi:hypothetical protein